MKSYLLSIVLTLLALPLVGKAAEPAFFSHQGKYPLSSGITLTISPDESSQKPKAMLMEADYGGSGVTMSTEHPDDPFLVYWDAATKTLWWGTPQSFGYLDVHTPHHGRSSSHPRSVPLHDYDQFPSVPAVFTTELDRAIPVHP